MDEFLIFFRLVGATSDEKYIYQLDFSTTPDSAWGEGWADISVLIPDLVPDDGVISSSYRIKTEMEFVTADKSSCFTMQDCIDDIIPLAYHLDGDDTLIFRFSNEKSDVLMTCDEYGIEYEELEREKPEGSSQIDSLLIDLDDEDGEDNDEDDIEDE